MAAPSVLSTTHTHGSEGHYTNLGIEITFAESLQKVSVSTNTFLLSNINTFEEVDVSISFDPSTAAANTKVVIQPKYLLTENTGYRLIIVGTDRSIAGELKSEDGTKLATSIIYEFTTGDGVFIKDSTTAKDADDLTLEGDLFLPSNVKALGTDFTVEKVRPKNHTADLNVNLTGDRTVTFHFSKILSGTASGISDWAAVEAYPLLDDGYLASGSVFLGESGSQSSDFVLPTGVITVTGKRMIITFDRDFPQNSAVDITLDQKIMAHDGEEYGGELEYSLAVQRFPSVWDARSIKREIKPAAVDFNDEYVTALLHKNTIMLWEKTGRGVSLAPMKWAAKKYVYVTTVLDLIEDKDYEKFLISGTQKQLGDMNVSTFTLAGRLALKISRLMKEKELAFNSLIRNWQFKTAVKQQGEAGTVARVWYDINHRFTAPHKKFSQPDQPIANIAEARRAGTTNPWI